jgi:hypothetical protein
MIVSSSEGRVPFDHEVDETSQLRPSLVPCSRNTVLLQIEFHGDAVHGVTYNYYSNSTFEPDSSPLFTLPDFEHDLAANE